MGLVSNRSACRFRISLTFVAEHECNSQESVLRTQFTLHGGILRLESVNEEQCQNNDVLCHLSRRQDRGDPFHKASLRICFIE